MHNKENITMKSVDISKLKWLKILKDIKRVGTSLYAFVNQPKAC